MSVFCLAPEQIEGLWGEFEQHVFRLERLGHVDAKELRDDLKAAKRQLWGYQESDGRVIGICVTRVTQTTCEIVAAAGTQTARGQIQQLYEHIERWAKELGLVRIRVIGRKGWLRSLNGFSQTGIVMEKDL